MVLPVTLARPVVEDSEVKMGRLESRVKPVK